MNFDNCSADVADSPIGRNMRPIDERSAVSSMIPDLGHVPLAAMPALTTVTHDVLDRVMPGAQTPPVPVAAFQSAI